MSFSDDLLAWYDRNTRILPWRGESDPYRIWLSEIMLQQTRTETVRGYYARFLERFPTVFALAEAPEEEVLKLWEGLGYYSRARNLHAAARAVAQEPGGAFPRDAASLRQLPGIGQYAANAIASIAYGEPVPALDGNQARVLSRVLAWEKELRTPFDLLEPAQALISRERPGDYNQALMDLGATVCVAGKPDCSLCPVAAHCRALADDAVQDFPRKPAPVPKREEDWTILLILLQGRLLVRRRPKGLLGGLYEFVALEGHPDPADFPDRLGTMGITGLRVIRPLPESKHIFTHKVWHMKGWLLECDTVCSLPMPVPSEYPSPDAPASDPDSKPQQNNCTEPMRLLAVDSAALARLPFPSALRIYREIAQELLEQ